MDLDWFSPVVHAASFNLPSKALLEKGYKKRCCGLCNDNQKSLPELAEDTDNELFKQGSHRPHTPPPLYCHLGSFFKRPKSTPVRPLACNWYYRA